MDQLDKYTGDLNFVVILSDAIRTAVEESDETALDIAIHTLGYMYRIAGRIHASPKRGKITDSDLYRTSARMWHDALRTLVAIQPKDTLQTKLKTTALRHWRLYGESLWLKEGVNVMTLKRASPLSEEKAYWRIPRQCFWLGCACSGHRPFHSVRVCKGCWRALYCSPLCQQEDWQAGHRKLCKSSRVDTPST